MAFGKIKPRSLSEDVLAEVSQQAREQQFFTAVPKSEDPENFPVYSIRNQTDLIYVPNFVVQGEDGVPELRMDKPFFHNLVDGKQFPKIRCTEGVESASSGLDGTCPICDNLDIVNELAQIEADNLLVSQGFQPGDDSKEAKKLTQGIYSDRIMKRKNRSFTFPIVVFERTVEKNEKTGRKVYKFVTDEEGYPKYQIMWYTVSEALYFGTESTQGKWKPELDIRSEELDRDILTPAGLWFNIKGDYSPDDSKWSARDAARNYSVTMLPDGPKGFDPETLVDFEKQLDKEAEAWTPSMAIKMVIANHFLPVDELQVEIDRLLQPVRDKVEMLKLGKSVSTNVPKLDAGAGQQKTALLSLDDEEIDE